MIRYIVFFVLALLAYTGINAQYWNNVYEWSNETEWSAIIEVENEFVLSGWNTIIPHQGCVLKANSNGDTTELLKYKGEFNNNILFQDIIFKNQNLYITGSAFGGYGFFKQIDESNNAISYYTDTVLYSMGLNHSIFNPKSSTFLLGGYAGNDNNNVPYILELNLNGELLWDSIYVDFPSSSYIADMSISEDGGYCLGFNVSISEFSQDAYLWETDSVGNRIRFKHFNYSAYDNIKDFLLTQDGGVLVTLSAYNGYQRIIKLNADWEDEFIIKDYYNEGEIKKIVELDDNSIIVFGSVEIQDENWNSHLTDNQIIKLDKSGSLLWQRTFINDGWDIPVDLIKTKKMNYILLSNNVYGDSKLHLIKTNCMGLLTEPEASFTYEEAAGEVAFTNTSLYVYPDSIDGGYYYMGFWRW